MAVWIPIMATVGGAILGGLWAYWLQRARPVVLVDRIRKSSKHGRSDTNVSPPIELIEKSDEYEYPLAVKDTGKAVTEERFVNNLDGSLQALSTEISSTLPMTENNAIQLRKDIAQDDFKAALILFARDDQDIFKHLKTAYLRGVFSFTAPQPDWDDLIRKFPSRSAKPESGACVVDTGGPLTIRLAYEDKTKDFAERMGKALAYEYKPDLLEAASALKEQIKVHKEKVGALQLLIQHSRAPFLRLVVEGTISNTGRTPFSIANRAKLVARVAGYPSSQGLLPSDVEIPLRVGVYVSRALGSGVLRSEKKVVDFDTPILVSPGASVRYTCVADNHLSEEKFSASLQEAFDGGDRNASLILGIITKRRRKRFRPLRSGDVLFRDLATKEDLIDRRWWRRRRRPSTHPEIP